MHDRLDHERMNEDAALGAALRALPASTPPHDGWLALSPRVRRRRVVRRTVWFTLPAAFAACFAMVMLWPLASPRAPLPAPAPITQRPQPASSGAAAASKVATLQASSRQWQTWVQNLDDNGAPLDGGALARAAALQERIAMIDLQISAARNPATAAGLWQQRVALLQRLGLLHLQPYAVAEHTHTTPDQTTIL